MSLKVVHIAFITISALLGLFLGGWGIRVYRLEGDVGGLALGLVGLALLVALIPYGLWFAKKMRHLALGLIISLPFVGVSNLAQACAVCYGDPSSPLSRGAKMGVLFLAGVVGMVLFLVSGVALSWWRRSKHL